jgi:transposase
VLGASSYSYAEATLTQTQPDWIGAHVRALTFFGGVPRQIVPDNPKVGVSKANWYEPGLNPAYQDFAATHYSTAILPARPRRPRDKAKVEVGVQVVERWILARLRNQRFFSLAELNGAIRTLLDALNGRPMRRLGVSRRQLFEELDRAALAVLPAEPYVYAEWRQRRVGLDYHVDIDGHYYSVPHRLLRQQVEARITDRTVEMFHKGQRVACHMLGGARGRHTTVAEHMPSSHRRHTGWTHERLLQAAAAIGSDTATLVEVILRSRPHPEQGFRACLGILRLARQYGTERLEAACRRGLEIGARSYGSINSILDKGLDRQPVPRANTRVAARPSQHPRFPLLPLKEMTLLTHPTVDQLAALGLKGVARAFAELQDNPKAAELGHAEWLALLLDREATERSNRRLTARLRHARLRQRATIEDVDYRAPRGLDRTLFQRLIAGDWITAPRNLIVEGPTGVGKFWLACALGNKACRDNHSVLYQRVPKLFPDLALARGDGRYPRLMKRLGKSSSTIGGSSHSDPTSAAICWKSSRNATAAAPR